MGIRKLGVTFRWDKHKVYKWLEFMKESGMLTSENVVFGTLLTVVNYDKYQSDTDTVAHTPAHEDTHEAAHKVTQRSKTGDRRLQTKDSKSACAGSPPDKSDEPVVGSPEWYAKHNDD